ncbi:MAG: zinc-ribbon domain-containing protein, partial [Deltaproteobacteria bacterium]|nr:zinc-ribbon domain-containing protein [Deltaproteobacteria bacterium]
MLIKCPICKKSYNVSDSVIPGEGALMNCPECDSNFVALPGGLTMLSDAGGERNYGLTPGSGGAVPAPVILDVGDKLQNGRFEVRALLGRGGYGSVHRVFDDNMEMELALKVVVPEGKVSQAVKNLANEFKRREQVKDRDHILSAYLPLLEEYKGLSLMLLPMELANGGNLRSWLDENQDVGQRKDQAIVYFKQICSGVEAIHKAGLAHLDLKPENILIAQDVIKISDFGLSRDLSNLGVMDPTLLRDGLGTANYMAPEQTMAARPKDVDKLADIYALGCILFELLDGQPPYFGTSREIYEKHEKGIKPNSKGINENLTNIIFKCLSTEPSDRYSTISALVTALDKKPQVLEKTVERKIKGLQWEYLDPEYRSQLSSRLIPDTVVIGGREVKDISVKEIMERGCVYGFQLRNGRLISCASIFGLLATGSFDLLKAWLTTEKEPFNQEDAEYIIRLFCVDHDVKNAIREIVKWLKRGKVDLRLAMLLAHGYDKVDAARKYLS